MFTLLTFPQLMEIAPRLDDLPRLLGERPYCLDDEDEEPTAAAAAADAMDADGPGALSSSSGCYTTEQLLDRVQVRNSDWHSMIVLLFGKGSFEV